MSSSDAATPSAPVADAAVIAAPAAAAPDVVVEPAEPALPAGWTRMELDAAVRSGARVSTSTPGLYGVVLRVRATDVELALPFPGRAFVRIADLSPPPRLPPGARVRTPFGSGVVRAARARPAAAAGFDYVVALTDNKLSGWSFAAPRHAVGYLAPADVALRGDDARTAEECVADADVLRAKGNAAFKAEDYDAALAEYTRSSEVLSSYRGRRLDAETRRLFLDSFLKSVGNSAATFLKLTPPNYERVISLTTEAIDIDSEDVAKQRSKNYKRRGLAHFSLRDWPRAAEDLKAAMADKVFANDPETRDKYTEARSAARKEAEKEKKTWQGAFAKLGSSEGGAAAESPSSTAAAASPASSAAGAGAGGKGVRFVSPEKAAAAGERAPALASSGNDAEGGQSPAAFKRTMYAGHTPHPRRAGAGADENEDGEDGAAADAGFKGTATEEAEEEEEEEEANSIWPWVLGGAAVLAVGVGAAYVLARRRR